MVVLPHLRPALAGASLLTFMTALGSFSAPYVFGGGFRVMPTQIVATRLNGEDQLAMAHAVTGAMRSSGEVTPVPIRMRFVLIATSVSTT